MIKEENAYWFLVLQETENKNKSLGLWYSDSWITIAMRGNKVNQGNDRFKN